MGGAEVCAHAHARGPAIAATRSLSSPVSRIPAGPTTTCAASSATACRSFGSTTSFRHIRTFADTYANAAIGRSPIGSSTSSNRTSRTSITSRVSTSIVHSLAERRHPAIHDAPRLLAPLSPWSTAGSGRPSATAPGANARPVAAAASARLVTRNDQLHGRARSRSRRPSSSTRKAAASRCDRVRQSLHRGNGDEEAKRVAHMRNVCAEVTHFLAPSQHLRERFLQFGVAPDRITVARNGCEHALFAPARRENTPPRSSPDWFSWQPDDVKAPHLILKRSAAFHPVRCPLIFSVRLPHTTVTTATAGGLSRSRENRGLAFTARSPTRPSQTRSTQSTCSLCRRSGPRTALSSSRKRFSQAFRSSPRGLAASRRPSNMNGTGCSFEPGTRTTSPERFCGCFASPLLDRLRQGIPPIRTIEEDVGSARRLPAAPKGGPRSAPGCRGAELSNAGRHAPHGHIASGFAARHRRPHRCRQRSQ